MKYLVHFLLWFSGKNVLAADGDIYGRYYDKDYEQSDMMGYVVGGVEVPIAMYPHVAKLIIKSDNGHGLCGGSIISDRVILTAAHCTVDKKRGGVSYAPMAYKVYLGSTPNSGVLYKVCKVVAHESYNPRKYFYDIAVLMLTKRIKFGSTIKTIEIAPNQSWKNEKYSFTIAGYGYVDSLGGVSRKLRATRMHFVDTSTCNQSQAAVPMRVPTHMFCMIGQRWTSDCFGDSGSGIVWKRFLVGMVATGRDKSCGADMMPSMYTNVPYFRNWIEKRLKEANSLNKQDCQSKTKSNRNQKCSDDSERLSGGIKGLNVMTYG